jgi:hypothetical protein
VPHRVHRVVTAAFWCMFSSEGKLGKAVEGGGCMPTPFHYIYHTLTITSKVAVYAPAEWADTLTLFHVSSLVKICTLWGALLLRALFTVHLATVLLFSSPYVVTSSMRGE